MVRLRLRPHRSKQRRAVCWLCCPVQFLQLLFVGVQRGVLACFFAPNLAFPRVSLPPRPHHILQQAGVIVGDAGHMPWTLLHLIQYKELPGPLMLRGPVAFSALWAVRQEAGARGQRSTPPLFSSPLLSTGHQSSGTHPLPLEKGPAYGSLSPAHGKVEKGTPERGTGEVLCTSQCSQHC